MTRGYCRPKPVPQWIVRKVQIDCRKKQERELREAYGIDPEREVLVTATRYLDGTYKFAAYGATYQYREELRKAGFCWDAQARGWYQEHYKPCLDGMTAPIKVVELEYTGELRPLNRIKLMSPDEFRRFKPPMISARPSTCKP